MTPCLLARIEREAPSLQESLAAVTAAETIDELVESVSGLVRELGVRMIETVVMERAVAATEWPACPTCGTRLHSKEWAAREVTTSLGLLRWERRVGRWPRGCAIGQVVPLDEAQGLAPNQRHSTELKRAAALVAVFVPLTTATAILERLTRVRLGASTLWHWIQTIGRRAQADVEAELARAAAGGEVAQEPLAATLTGAFR